VISTYYPIQSEIDTLSICLKLKQDNPRLLIALPEMVEDSRVLKFKEYVSEDKLKLGKFKVKEPNDSCKELIPNIVLTPFLAFDITKNRLGYGMGYYDNTLKHLYSEKYE
jgi:5-formyltetrahydrofolate cyclo-ligase